MENASSFPKEILKSFLLVAHGQADPKTLQADQVVLFFDRVLSLIAAEPTVIDWESRETIIVGDTHCDVDTSIALLAYYPATRLVFLGDYTGRSAVPFDDIRNVILLFLEKFLTPERIILLRGNHEDEQISGTNGFLLSLMDLFGSANGKIVWKKLIEVFHQLPLAVSMNDIIIVHGGLPKVVSLDEIRAIPRGISFCDNPLLTQILWNDVTVKDVMQPGGRCSGAFSYGKTDLAEVLHSLQKKVLIHGHNYSGKGVGCDGQNICLYTSSSYFYLPRGTPGDEADVEMPVPGNVIAAFDGKDTIEVRALPAFQLGELPFVKVEFPAKGPVKAVPLDSFQTSVFRFLYDKFKQQQKKKKK